MLLFSTALSKHKLQFIKLSQCPEHIPLAAKWAEDEWGYIRNKGIEYREGVMNTLSNDVHIGFFAKQPIAMFALIALEKIPNTLELMYVYVDKDYRGLGFGNQIVEAAKQLAAEAKADSILLDTLKPNLNRGREFAL